MKNLKKLLFVPVLALGTLSSCYGKNDTTCPEEKKCDACPEVTPSNPSDNGSGVSKDGHSLSVDTKEIKVLVDEEIGKVKHIVATASPSTDTLSYSSNDESVAVVSSDGTITGIEANKNCKITVSSSAGLKIEIDVFTYSADKYFVYDVSNPGVLHGCIDPDVVELELPSTNNSTTVVQNAVGTFNNLRKLKKLIIPEGFTTLESFSFMGCNNLEEVSLPSTVNNLKFATGLFISSKNSMKNLNIAEGNSVYKVIAVTENSSLVFKYNNSSTLMLDYAFGNFNQELFTLDQISESFTQSNITISSYSFSGLESLVDIQIPEGITTVNKGAFTSCKNLKNVKIPASLSTIYDGAFTFNENLEGFEVDEANTKFITKDDQGNDTNTLLQIYRTSGGVNYVYISSLTKNSKFLDNATYNNGLVGGNIDALVGKLSVSLYAGMGLKYNGILKLPNNLDSIPRYTFSFSKMDGIFMPKITTMESNNYVLWSENTNTSYLGTVMLGNLLSTDNYFPLCFNNNSANIYVSPLFGGCSKNFTIFVDEEKESFGSNRFNVGYDYVNSVLFYYNVVKTNVEDLFS